MIDQQVICPYTGLRSFTEDESLYFKGRDLQVDQITSLLEKNKFLMLTGASGEGKSSLIYAGLIPNARAGFFKAKYSNWVIADFRPERSPVYNMARAVGEEFGIRPSTVETELRRGYSSLIDLYTNSEFYVDEESEQWLNASDDEKKEKKRKSANLLILADQFEEFFTNPENFYDESPSQDSQIVVNLLLETARLALKNNIPVYVVCTMRSDYIGQCSAFRTLPDYIGFSQFFVPRLKRKDLKQVIEEPAILSGNRISQRLIERLVYDLSEGVDQLPILQHALNQIWRAADQGREEMDLLHYAMTGGMPANELPEEDQQRFLKWYKALPEHQRGYYKETGLHRVIEIHADLLYENAWEYYNRNHEGDRISQSQARKIITTTFACLTKIDNSRAVRNRMSLQEITEIIDSPGISADMVASLLNIFREEGNSFIRPFLTEDADSKNIAPETVLDITHESLIRNWSRLKDWADQEFEYYMTWLDLRKQLQRWKESKKSSSFLLPIGPLSFFENWYQECRPNAGWIRRYSEIEGDKKAEIAKAEGVLTDIREFLKRSARKVAVPRAFMRYGPKRIATAFAIILMILLSSYYWIDAERKQNDRVIERVRSESGDLLQSTQVNSNFKAEYLLIEERYDHGSALRYLSGLDMKTGLTLSGETYKHLLLFNKYDKSELKRELMDRVHQNYQVLMTLERDNSFLLNELNSFTTTLAYDNYYNPDDQTRELLRMYVDEGYGLVTAFLEDGTRHRASVPVEMNYAVQQWLTFGTASGDKTRELLQLFSPFENANGQSVFDLYYPKGSYEINGRVSNDYNGGHHTLASLYASTGDIDKVIQSFNQIRLSGQDDYFVGSLFNNYNHILAILYQYGHRDTVPVMLKWLEEHYPTNVPLTVYRNSVIRAGYMSTFYRGNLDKNHFRSYRGYFFPNLTLSERDIFNMLADDYEALIKDISNMDEQNYMLAINRKRRAVYNHKYAYDRQLTADIDSYESDLAMAVEYFRNTDEDYLEESVPVTYPYYGEGVRSRDYRRRDIFVYPDYFEGWFSSTYHSDLFFRYIDKNNLFEEFYRTPDELDLIHMWLVRAHEVKPLIETKRFDNVFPLSDEIFERIAELNRTHTSGSSFDMNLLNLIMANKAFEKGNIENGISAYELFDRNNFQASRDRYEYLEKTFFLNQMKDIGVNLALAGEHAKAVELAEKFEKDHEKAFAYIFIAENLYMDQLNPLAFTYLDSAMSKAGKLDLSSYDFGVNNFIDIRYNLILLLSRIGGKELNQLAGEYLREMIDFNKTFGLVSAIYGIAEEGNFYRALTAMPSTLTETEELLLKSVILWQAAIHKDDIEDRERWVHMDNYYTYNYNYIFYLPN
jgi:energy-coupling factor transporter ATP-binding protein EcfA2